MEKLHHCGALRELWLHDNRIPAVAGLESLVHLQVPPRVILQRAVLRFCGRAFRFCELGFAPAVQGWPGLGWADLLRRSFRVYFSVVDSSAPNGQCIELDSACLLLVLLVLLLMGTATFVRALRSKVNTCRSFFF